MPRSAVSFPLPVIGHGDDIAGGVPPVELVRHIDQQTITLSFSKLTTDNATVAGLIASGRAAFAIRVSCPATYFRKVWSTPGPALDIPIPASEVTNSVAIRVHICATEAIASYRPADLHPDYGTASFDIQPGDVLAIADGFDVTVMSDWDPLTGPIDSIVRVCEGPSETGAFRIDLDTDYIEIWLSKRDWRLYNQTKQKYAPTLHVGIILAALTAGIARVQETNGEDDTTMLRWMTVVRKRLEQKNLLGDDPLQAAQALLDEPLHRALRNIVDRLEELSP